MLMLITRTTTWTILLISFHQTQSVLNLLNGFLQTAGTNLARLNPCPYRDTGYYRPRSSFDIACLGNTRVTYQPLLQSPQPTRVMGPHNPPQTGFTLPYVARPAPVERDTKDNKRAVLVAEMQDINLASNCLRNQATQ